MDVGLSACPFLHVELLPDEPRRSVFAAACEGEPFTMPLHHLHSLERLSHFGTTM